MGKRIFLTSVEYTGDLGGATGGDNRCANHAAAALLGGQWKAWLSTSSTLAVDRFSSDGPWNLLDGTRVFNNKANLATAPMAVIDLTEQQQRIDASAAVSVWTGGVSSGAKDRVMETCADWTNGTLMSAGRLGFTLTVDDWTAFEYDSCSKMARLYCFEQ